MRVARPSFAAIERLMKGLILPFYAINRDITAALSTGRRLENNAEHSWALAVMACALAPHVDTSLDVGKVCQYAVVHDIVEIYAGDTSILATDEHHDSKDDREQAALTRIKKEFAVFSWIGETMEGYHGHASPEARFVRSVDKCLALWTLYTDEAKHDRDAGLTLEFVKEQMVRQREKAKAHEGAFEYYEEIHAALIAHPEFFTR